MRLPLSAGRPAAWSSSRGRRAAPRDQPGGDRAGHADDTRILAHLARAVDLPGPLARDGAALGDHAEAHDLRAHAAASSPPRRRRCPSRSAASGTGTTATPGSGTPRSRCTRCSGWASPRRRPRSPAGCATGSRSRRASDAAAAEHHVPGRRFLRPRGGLLDHWEGYRGSRPVRIGNGAADQLQLDIYGEALDSIYFATSTASRSGTRAGSRSRSILDWLADHWDQPEEGIWETRGGRKDFTYGRAMSWVAFDRAIRLATEHGRPAPLDRWTSARRRHLRPGLDRGLERRARRVRAALRHRRARLVAAADAAVGFIAPHDPHVALDPGRHGRGAGHRQPGLPLRPRRLAGRTARRRRARSRCAPSATSTRWPGPAGSRRPG